MFGRAILLLTALLAGCSDFPREPEETLKRAKAGEPLVVGYSLASPWVRPGPAEPTGLEADLVRGWAAAAGVPLRWVEGGENQIVQGLHHGTIDIGIGGFTDTNPHVTQIGMTQPYLTARIVVGIVPGTQPPQSLENVPIRYDQRRPEFAAAIRSVGAVPVPGAVGELRPIAAVYASELQTLGLQPLGERLLSERHVIGTAAGENALTFSLDRFLHSRRGEIEARLGQEAAR